MQKSQICFYIISKTNGPKRRRRKIKKRRNTGNVCSSSEELGAVLVKHLWSGGLPCESASLKDFSFCLTVPLKHQEISLQNPPLCIFWVWRAFEGEEPEVLNKVYTCRNTNQSFTFSKVVWKLHCLWRVCTPRPNSLSYPATHTWPVQVCHVCREWPTFRTIDHYRTTLLQGHWALIAWDLTTCRGNSSTLSW